MKDNHFEIFFQLSSDLLCMIDLHGYFILVNPAFQAVLGYTEKELTSRPYSHFIHPDDQEITTIQALKLLRGERVQQFEVRYITKEQKTVWLSWTSTIILEGYFYAAAKDITQQKEAEESLQTSVKKFQSLVQNGYEISTIIGADGTYKYHSDSLYRVLGYHPHELLGLKPTDLVHPNDRGKVQKGMEQLQNAPYVNNGIPYRIKAADGTYKWIESTGTNMIGDPAIRGIVVNSRDVTEKVLLEQELYRQQQEMALSILQAQEKERTWLGQELHDNINQMLTSVQLYVEHMQRDQASHQMLLPKCGGILQSMVKEIRKLSHQLVLPSLSGTFDLKQSIEELAHNFFSASGTELRLDIDSIEPQLLGQDFKTVLYRIVQEQFTNIFKYAEASLIHVSLRKDDHRIELSISDNGKGFDPSLKGKGIGLSNISNRARILGGITRLETAPGKGCQINIIFSTKEQ